MLVKNMSVEQAKAVLQELTDLLMLRTVDDAGLLTNQFVGDMVWLKTRIRELQDKISNEGETLF